MSAVEDYRQYVRHAGAAQNYGTKQGLALSADAAIAELEAEVERLSVCANCAHHEYRAHDWSHYEESCSEGAPEGEIEPHFNCYFKPSHWKKRKP